MKKIILIAASAALAFSAGAQTMYDAITFSQSNYYGTARTMGLNNAVTAVGGDLGTIGINPAGSAVSYYGQFTLTPGITISSVGSQYSNWGESKYVPGAEGRNTRFNLPNCGISMSFATGRDRGLKNMTFAFVSNQTNNYNMAFQGFGRNNMTSRYAELATAAYGYDESVLAEYSSFNCSNVPWDVLAAYQAGTFGSYEKDEYSGYVGNTERIAPDGSYHYVPGELSQGSSVSKWGSKNDIVINMGMNFNDNLYAGFNIGIPAMDYRYSEYFSEAPVNVEQFPIAFKEGDTYLRSVTSDYQYIADVSGIYAKAGLIWLPVKGLRLGAAIQSPTALTVRECWQYGATSSFQNSKFDGDVISPEGEYSYGIRTPYIVNLGAAVTIGTVGLISVDYELADYSVIKFRDIYDEGGFRDNSAFYDLNMTSRNFCGLAHNLRAGAEFRVTPAFSLRAGYSLATNPERHWINSAGMDVTADDYLQNFGDYNTGVLSLVSSEYYREFTQSYSLGFGYSSPGSFFADFAVRATSYPESVFAPYYDYYGYTSTGELLDMQAPRIKFKRNLFDVALTFGWRF